MINLRPVPLRGSCVAAAAALVVAGCGSPVKPGSTGGQGPSAKVAAPAAAVREPVYAMVELTATPTTVQYGQQLAAKGQAKATNGAIAHLATVRAEQQQTAQAVALAGIPGLREVYRLQRVFNGILYQVSSPGDLAQLAKAPGVKAVHRIFPKKTDNVAVVPFVGAAGLWTTLLGATASASGTPLTGEGIRIGVIDTGIDYTHQNFGGTDPSTVTYTTRAFGQSAIVDLSLFPTAKVVGGWDFAGSSYDASGLVGSTVPQPDPNPIDGPGGHGTHVAGTIAGTGIYNSDGTLTRFPVATVPYSDQIYGTYDFSQIGVPTGIGPGAAPGAQLFALKVFGDNGGTTVLDSLAVEWAADPNGDGDFSDRLDVVNLSLSRDFGSGSTAEAAIYANAMARGIVVVASAGDGGDVTFAAGSPGAHPEPISVGASFSGGAYFQAMHVEAGGFAWTNNDIPIRVGRLQFPNTPVGVSYSAPVTVALPIDLCTPAATNFFAGAIALAHKGACSLSTQISNAEGAGAQLLLIVDDPLGADPNGAADEWGGSSISSALPVFTVPGTDGANFENFISAAGGGYGFGSATLTAGDEILVTEPDALASFSSRGPFRLGQSALLKPDVVAPGVQVVSSMAGTANGSQRLSGSSMATALTSGVVALLRQAHPTWKPDAIKALLMNTALHDTVQDQLQARAGSGVSPLRQGAGRIDAVLAVNAPGLAFDKDHPERVSVSFATRDVTSSVTERRTIRLRNTTSQPLVFTASVDSRLGPPGATVQVNAPGTQLMVPANQYLDVALDLVIDLPTLTQQADTSRTDQVALPSIQNVTYGLSWLNEVAGYVVFATAEEGSRRLRVPYYAAILPASTMSAGQSYLQLGQVTGTAALPLSGNGLNLDAPGEVPPPAWGVHSLVTPLELAYSGNGTPNASPAPPVGFDPDELKIATIKYAGVISNLPDFQLNPSPVDPPHDGPELYFGIVTEAVWDTPNALQFEIRLRSPNAEGWEYVLSNHRGNDLLMSQLLTLSTGQLQDEDYLNGLNPLGYMVPIFLSDAVLLPVFAGHLGLSPGNSVIEYQISIASQELGGVVDTTPVLRYDMYKPSLSAHTDPNLTLAQPLGTVVQPVWLDVPTNPMAIDYDLAQIQDAQVGAKGLLLIHHQNGAGSRGQALGFWTNLPYLTCATTQNCTDPAFPVCDTNGASATLHTCVGCLANADCANAFAGPLCNVAAQTCVACLDSSACGAGQSCDLGTHACVNLCTAQGANLCSPGSYCNAGDGACVADCHGPGARPCPGGSTCNQTSAACLQTCNSDSPCSALSARPYCDLSDSITFDVCVACVNDRQCAGNQFCDQTSSGPTRGTCVGCLTTADCGGGLLCDTSQTSTAANTCVGCLATADCGAGETCDTAVHACLAQCTAPDANACPAGDYCARSSGLCVADCRKAASVACAAGTLCSATSGLCLPAPAVSTSTRFGATADCPAGGVLLQTGLDLNGNGVLDAGEVTQTSTICNGTAGATGSTGAVGATGQTGQAGSTGAVGATGAAGSNGSTGATGAGGATGQTGATGSAGQTGATGATGAAGQAGSTGLTGATGTTGLTGATGDAGETGGRGAVGATGATGSDGQRGATGAVGATGAAGSNGVDGVNGANGGTGSQGGKGSGCSTGGGESSFGALVALFGLALRRRRAGAAIP